MSCSRWRRVDALTLITLALMGPLLGGCAGRLSNDRRWGADATLSPGWSRVWRAARDAALDARTIVPAAAAGVLAIGDLDERLAEVATDKAPVFGSGSSARTYSDAMQATLVAEAIVTALAAPSGDVDRDWWLAKLKGIAVEGGALGLTHGVIQALQHGVGRTRPDKSGDTSFPSGHASSSFAAAALASSNLRTLGLDSRLQTGLEVANTLAATSVAWARVEGNKHFPTDVFVGAALGNFLGLFIHGAFLGVPEEGSSYWRIVPVSGGAMLVTGWRF